MCSKQDAMQNIKACLFEITIIKSFITGYQIEIQTRTRVSALFNDITERSEDTIF